MTGQAVFLRKSAGFTLVEMMVSAGIASLILGAMVLGAAAFQNVFFATNEYYKSTADQMRVMDYIGRDIRSAVNGTVGSNGQTLSVVLPDYIDPATNQPRLPTVKSGTSAYFGQPTATVSYAGSVGDSVTVAYTTSGNQITRNKTIVRSGTTSTANAVIATNVDNLTMLNSLGTTGTTNFSFGANGQPKTVTTSASFAPKFNRANSPDARAATTVYATTVVRNIN